MTTFVWILGGGILMSVIALVGGVTALLTEDALKRAIVLLVAFAAGTLLGGAFFHMIPAAVERAPGDVTVFVWMLAGFATFFALEQFLHWHHCNRAPADCRKPLTYLILVGDALHNFLGGLAVAGTFLLDVRLGVAAWLAAAAHEIPQELGEFGVLIHGGWTKGKALLFNFISALTFLIGGLIAYFASFRVDVVFLVPFAAGNFLYIAASDLVPEVNKHHKLSENLRVFVAFVGGLGLLLLIRLVLD
ncbi:MAG: zinc transporter [Gemmatimonas sp. SG8_17]|nr:MAG: zinc transporter [Gemmatimonas sp. SG8_17]